MQLVTYIVKPMATILITRRLSLIASLQSVDLPSPASVRKVCLVLSADWCALTEAMERWEWRGILDGHRR